MSGNKGGRVADEADFSRFENVSNWIFDLDNTLYPHHVDIFPQVQARIRDFVQRRLKLSSEAADRLQHDFYERYGATLRGLIVEHGMEADEFLEYVHDIDHSSLTANPKLAEAISRLPGRRYILTNGSRRHAEKVAEALGVTRHFDDIFDIVWAGHLPKPSRETYELLVSRTGLDPRRAAMFEDLPRNLLVPRQLGMVTVLVVPAGTESIVEESWKTMEDGARQVDFLTSDLTGFLGGVLTAIGTPPD